VLGGRLQPTSKRIELDRRTHDFGVVRQNAVLETAFRLTNRGEAPLRVFDARGDCGCVTAKFEPEVVLPGQAATIAVVYRTFMVVGVHPHGVVIKTDDPETPNVAVEVSCDVSAGVVLAPANFFFPMSLAGTSPGVNGVVQWKEGVGRPFRVLKVEVQDVDMTAEVAPWTEAKDPPAWKGFEVRLRFRAPPPIGQVSGRVVIHTDDPDTPKITSLVGGAITGRVWIPQRKVSYGAVPFGRGGTLKVPVLGFDASIRLGEVKARSTKGKVRVEVAKNAQVPGGFEVEVRLPEDTPVGTIDDVVEVTTEVEGEETHFVTVEGMVMPKPPR
jgi:hypothetical protein